MTQKKFQKSLAKALKKVAKILKHSDHPVSILSGNIEYPLNGAAIVSRRKK